MVAEHARRALIAAYYLSRFDRSGYSALGFSTMTEAHEELGKRFGLTADALKNRRDEFDPIHDNSRVGWHQREMRPSRALIVEQFSGVGEEALRRVILAWLRDEPMSLPPLATVDDDDVEADAPQHGAWLGAHAEAVVGAARTITGRKAEEHFADWFKTNQVPCAGVLIDARADGLGYDFCIRDAAGTAAFVEVKGLAGDSGTITMTGREWDKAKVERTRYHIALVRHVESQTPVVDILSDPASYLEPTLRLTSVVQESWTVHTSKLK